ncbi:MAG: hypothetical protein R3345_09015 [Fulvivirga sp.]|nr:hypothetical protein [Fulvivirga sp.]
MKLPSLLRTPRHQRFHIEPRYYDPVKEEIEERTARIKRELQLNKNGEGEESDASRLRGSFRRRRAKARGINIMQAVIVLLLASGFVGFLYFGNIAIYIFLMVSSLLLYLKVRGTL